MNRVPKVEETIKETVALIVQQELKDPRVGLVTVTRVKATADLQHAVVFFSVLDTEHADITQAGLTRAAPYVRRLVGERLRLRFTPELKFQFDPSIEGGIRVQKLLDAAKSPSTPQTPSDAA